MSTPTTVETINIDSAGNSVALELLGATLVSVHIRGDASADYAVDVRARQGSWIQGVTSGYSGSADYDDVLERPAEAIRIRCTNGTAGSGDEATITLMGG